MFSTCFWALLVSLKLFPQTVHCWALGPFSGNFWIYRPKLGAPSALDKINYSFIKQFYASLKNDDLGHFWYWMSLCSICTGKTMFLGNECSLHASSSCPCHFLVSHRLCTYAFSVHFLDPSQCTHRTQSYSHCLHKIWLSQRFVIKVFYYKNLCGTNLKYTKEDSFWIKMILFNPSIKLYE